MEVTFTLTPDDILHYARHYYRTRMLKALNIRPALIYAFLGLMLLVIPAGLWGALDLWRKTGVIPWGLILGFVLISGVACLYLPPTRWRIVKFTRKQPESLIPHTVNISPEWLSAKTSMSESKHSWQTVYSLEEDPDYLYLFISKGSAHVVPKRAFGSRAQAQAFLDKARLYWDAAKSGQTVFDGAAEDTGVWPPPPRSMTTEETTG